MQFKNVVAGMVSAALLFSGVDLVAAQQGAKPSRFALTSKQKTVGAGIVVAGAGLFWLGKKKLAPAWRKSRAVAKSKADAQAKEAEAAREQAEYNKFLFAAQKANILANVVVAQDGTATFHRGYATYAERHQGYTRSEADSRFAPVGALTQAQADVRYVQPGRLEGLQNADQVKATVNAATLGFITEEQAKKLAQERATEAANGVIAGLKTVGVLAPKDNGYTSNVATLANLGTTNQNVTTLTTRVANVETVAKNAAEASKVGNDLARLKSDMLAVAKKAGMTEEEAKALAAAKA